MTAGRAYEMDVEIRITLVTPEDAPLAIFGTAVSAGVAELLGKAGIDAITAAYAEVGEHGQISIHPEDRHLQADRVVALPELSGATVRGVPLDAEGFIHVDRFGGVPTPDRCSRPATRPTSRSATGASAPSRRIWSPDRWRSSPVPTSSPNPFIRCCAGCCSRPRGPLMSAHITGGHGSDSELSSEPLWAPPSKIAAKYLAPYLESLDGGRSGAGTPQGD